MDIRLTYSTDDGPQDASIDNERTTFGRGSDVDHRIDDDGLSRLHATVYREGDRVWIVDENSTNGTFVNGDRTRPAGTPLKDGDVVRIGNHTNMRVSVSQEPSGVAAVTPQTVSTFTPSVRPSSTSWSDEHFTDHIDRWSDICNGDHGCRRRDHGVRK